MALETITHISDLVVTNPTAGDPLSQADDHIRGIKTALKTDLPNITGPITATQGDLNGSIWTQQTWQNVAASRAQGTTYTNSTGRPIFVSVSLTLTSANPSTVSATLNSAVVLLGTTASGLNFVTSITFIVPPTHTYNVSSGSGPTSINSWMELR